MKALTILGITFIPLAYVASLFSMSDGYRPGGELFWVYFAVALPLVVLIIIGYYTLELGYARGSLRWSLKTAITVIRKSLKRKKRGEKV